MEHFDPELESSILGTMALNPSMIDLVDLAEDDFTQSQNRTIFATINKMSKEGRPISLYTLGLELKTKKIRVLELYHYWESLDLKGADFLEECCSKLKELTVMREMAAAIQMGASPSDMIERANELQVKLSSETVQDLSQVMTDFNREYFDKMSNDGVIGVSTGFPTIDSQAPLERGGLVTVAARSSVGKSSFALSIAKNVADSGFRVLFVSVEMSILRLMDRLVAMLADAPLSEIRRAAMPPERLDEIKDKVTAIKDNLNMVFLPHATSGQISRLVTREHRRKPIDLVVIDYLQLLCDPRGKNITDDIRIGNMTRAFKVLAGKLNNSVMLLSQVNRQAASEENGMPQLHQLRGSGNIEQDSDVVLVLNRKSKSDTFGELMVAKNRNGACDISVPVVFSPKTTEYKEQIRTQYEIAQDTFMTGY